MPRICHALLKDYCANCSFAGIHFIADDTKHWTERLLWVVLVILSWYGSALLIISAWDAYVLNPISFVVETTYIDWETKMPAVAVCEFSNDDKVYNVADTIWTPNHLYDLEDALKEIAHFRGKSYSLVEICYMNKEPDPLCPMSNYSYYANLIRSDCPNVIQNCTYNRKEFDCCTYFQPIPTDLGTCYIINSIQTKNPNPYPMVCNRTHNRGILSFDVLLPSTVYTLGEDEVPSVTSLQSSNTLKIQLKSRYSRHVAIRNIENDPRVVDNTVAQRSCRFNFENEGGLYPHYSYSACTVLCRKQAQLDICGCNDHFMLGTEEAKHCKIAGIACLSGNSSHLTTLKPSWANRPGMACNCLPSCNETEVTIIKDYVTPGVAKKKAEVEIVLAYLPTERFKRNVIRSRLDLVVSVGGTTGLFVGASVLSFVELIFYFTIRFVSNLWMERRKQKNNNIMPVRHQTNDYEFGMNNEQLQGRKYYNSHYAQGPYADSGILYTKLITYDKMYLNRTTKLSDTFKF